MLISSSVKKESSNKVMSWCHVGRRSDTHNWELICLGNIFRLPSILYVWVRCEAPGWLAACLCVCVWISARSQGLAERTSQTSSLWLQRAGWDKDLKAAAFGPSVQMDVFFEFANLLQDVLGGLFLIWSVQWTDNITLLFKVYFFSI